MPQLGANLEHPIWVPTWDTTSGSQFGEPHMGANLGKSLDWHVTVHCDHYVKFVGMSIVQNGNPLYCHYATLVDISLGRHNTVLCGHHEPRTTWLFYVAIIPYLLEFA